MAFKFQGVDFLHLDSSFSEDELLVRRTARDFVEDNLVPIIEECYRSERFPRELVPVMGELGFFGANLQGYGCAGMSNVEYGLVMQELERGDSGFRSFVSVQSALCMYPIYTFGSDEQKNTWLPAMQKGEKLEAVVETSCGTFQIALDSQRAPKTVNSFVFLSEGGFYDGLDFHRVAPGFVIQGGDPLGTGTGGPGYSVDEKPPANLSYTKGTVAMAKSSAEPPGRSGSQFFVVLAPDAGLPPEYALVGKVDKGLDVVERIGKLGTPAEKPKQTVLIEKLSIEKG